MHSFNIIQWNARSLKANKLFLDTLLFSHKIHCAIISESWLKPSEQFNFNGYNIVRSDREDGYGGSCIKRGINYSTINCEHLNSQRTQICAIKLNLKDRSITIVSIYSTPYHNTSRNDWLTIFSYFQTPAIIGGDFNAHHDSWGCETSDREGKEIIEVITDMHFTMLNDGTPTLFQAPGHRKSAIDLSFCSPTLSPSLSWNVLNNTYGSNHYPIILNLHKKMNYKFNIFPSSIWDTKKANWNEYYDVSKTISENINLDEFSSHNSETKYDILTHIINETALKTIPQRFPKQVNSFRCNSWWDDDCKTQVQTTKIAFNAFKDIPSVNNFISCKQAIARTKYILKQKRKQSWTEFCTSINKNTNISDVWKKK